MDSRQGDTAHTRPQGVLRLLAGLLGGLALAAAGLALASDPGSKDDPLVTLSYVKGLAQFQRAEIRAGKSLRLGTGAELVILEPSYEDVEVKGLDAQKSGLINLTSGERVGTAALTAHQHYVNSAAGEQFLKFSVDATVLVRGDWQ
jgi:hypothetical protein